MKKDSTLFLALAIVVSALAGCGATTPRPVSKSELEAAQKSANSVAGMRRLPPREIPVPDAEVSPQMKAMIGAPYPDHFNAAPANAEEWKALVERRAKPLIASLPALQEKMGVTVEAATIAGVKCFVVSPKALAPENQRRMLMHLHGGGYVFAPREAGLPEAIMLAGLGGFRVISVDYRMPPDHPYPAAMDDAMSVWQELLRTFPSGNMAVFGSSTGGAMTLALVLRAKSEGVALPAAIAPGSPWSDMAKIGDSYATNEWVDNILVTWDGWLGRAAKLYAAGRDFKDPQLSPIYGDFSGFPPAILTSGTRDLFLSNTVRTHRKLRRAGVEADLNVYEGQSHVQFARSADVPETQEAFKEIARFFDKHLGR